MPSLTRSLFSLSAAGFLLAATLPGCRSTATVFGNDGAEVDSEIIWLVSPPELETPPPPLRTASLTVENDTDLDGDALAADVKSFIQDAGYLLVGDEESPHFRVTLNLREFSQNDPPDSGRALANEVDLLADAAVTVADDAGSDVTGYAERTLELDDYPTYEQARIFRTKEWALVADIVVVQQLDAPATFTLGGDDEATTSDEFPHGARLAAYVRQIGLIESDAISILEAKLRDAVRELLP